MLVFRSDVVLFEKPIDNWVVDATKMTGCTFCLFVVVKVGIALDPRIPLWEEDWQGGLFQVICQMM